MKRSSAEFFDNHPLLIVKNYLKDYVTGKLSVFHAFLHIFTLKGSNVQAEFVEKVLLNYAEFDCAAFVVAVSKYTFKYVAENLITSWHLQKVSLFSLQNICFGYVCHWNMLGPNHH